MRHLIALDLGEFWLPYAFKTLLLNIHSKRFKLSMVSQFDLHKGDKQENNTPYFGKRAS